MKPDGISSRSSAIALRVVAVIFLIASLQYVLTTLAGRRHSRNVDFARWDRCVAVLDSVGDPGFAASLWERAMRGRENVARKSIEADKLRDEKYSCRCRVPEVYSGAQPKLTAIVQSFNHRTNIANISGGLKASSSVEEIVICEDGSTDGSLDEWHGALPGPSHFVIRSNNLHELRSYNRAMRMSAGDIVLLMQDDDLLPQSDRWIENALRLFESKPDLGLLGGYIGQLWDPDSSKGFEYGEQVSSHGGLRRGNTQPIQYIDPTTDLPFMYAECVWIAPVFVRRSLIRKAGGLELTIAKTGEPGVWQDCVFSYEAWVSGFTVGLFDASFERGVGGHGSAASPEKVKQRARVWERAVAYTNRKYYRRRIHNFVVDLNNRTLTQRYRRSS